MKRGEGESFYPVQATDCRLGYNYYLWSDQTLSPRGTLVVGDAGSGSAKSSKEQDRSFALLAPNQHKQDLDCARLRKSILFLSVCTTLERRSKLRFANAHDRLC
jgi:hypothetical protein